MRIDITKGKTSDRIAITRDDGSRAATQFPKKGRFPHDAIHYVVERAFGFKNAFWGHVAAGRHPEEIAGLAAEAGHPSAKRGREPDDEIVELIKAERLVECFEAEMWRGESDLATLQSVADAAMAQSKIPPLGLSAEVVDAVRQGLADLSVRWAGMNEGETLSLIWDEK